MKSLRWIAAALLVMGSVTFLMWPYLSEADPRAPGGEPPLIDLSSSESCRDCHKEVFAEWESSFHALAFLDPLVRAKEQSNNFRNVSCIPCHAPAPILEMPEMGKGARVYERFAFREEGVDCLSCHKLGNHVAGTRTLAAAQAPCRPVEDPRLSTTALCAPCHNQHQTVDEWETSSYALPAEGFQDCNDCHMPEVHRQLDDGTTRKGRSHRFLGGHDLTTLRSGLAMSHRILEEEDGSTVLEVSLTNSGTGHNYPSDARHRAVDMVVTLLQPDGIEVPARKARPAGREPGTERRRFRNPYRQETERLDNLRSWGRENTQIQPGETLSLNIPFVAARVAKARIQVIYKLTPLVSDEEGTTVFEEVIDL